MLEIPTTRIQADAIADAAQHRGMSVTDWATNCLLTYATNHLGRAFADWLAVEQGYVERGDYLACGATRADGEPPCARILGHLTDAVVARESHVGVDTYGQRYSWQQEVVTDG